MKENIKEDIKRISNLIDYVENADYVDASQCIDSEDIQAIDHVISDYKRVLKENELAKEALKKQCEIADERNQLLKENEELKHKYDVFVKISSDVIENSISKQKVKDKIEKLNKLKEETNYLSVYMPIQDKIEVLQELLKEDK